jgi:hypothetical protein
VCFFINLFEDDSWQPWTLEWFYQVEDDQKRLDFLRGAELLQLYCELQGEPNFRKQRQVQAIGVCMCCCSKCMCGTKDGIAQIVL